jgi:uncharacterized protein (DUF305 family)
MEHSHQKTDNNNNNNEHKKHYTKLLVMIVISFACMYVLMYAMVDQGANVFPSTNQFYMAGLMTMPMIMIELLLMRAMYKIKNWNIAIGAVSVVGLIGFYTAIRQQAAINDKQFLKSMIPHHAGAILMCNEADISDPEIKKLCEEIIASQKREIEQMKSKLTEIKER